MTSAGVLEMNFSNSLIIHTAKTKENHKCDVLELFFSWSAHLFEKRYQTLALVLEHISKHLELSLKNSAAPHFSTLEMQRNTCVSGWYITCDTVQHMSGHLTLRDGAISHNQTENRTIPHNLEKSHNSLKITQFGSLTSKTSLFSGIPRRMKRYFR